MKIAILRENLRRNMVFHRCFSDWDIPRNNCTLRAWKKWSKQERCILGSTEKREREKGRWVQLLFSQRCAHNARDTPRIFFVICHLCGWRRRRSNFTVWRDTKITDNNNNNDDDDNDNGDDDANDTSPVHRCRRNDGAMEAEEYRVRARARDGRRYVLSVDWPVDRANKPRCNLIENAPAENTCASDEFRSPLSLLSHSELTARLSLFLLLWNKSYILWLMF